MNKSRKLAPKKYASLITDNQPFRNLWLALTISYFGDAFYEIAIVWYVYTVTGSSMQVGFILVATFLPSVLIGLFLGVMVDRFHRKRLMQIAQIVQSLAVGILALSITFGFFQMWLLYLLTIVQSAASALFLPAQYALIPNLVAREQLITANSFFSSSRQIATLFGAVLGGSIVAWMGASYAIGFNALTFIIALGFIQLMKVSPSALQIDTESTKGSLKSNMLPEIREGLRWLSGQSILLKMLLLATLANMALGPINVLLPMLIQDVFHAGATALGFFDGALGLGILLGGIGIGIASPKRVGVLFGIALGVEGIGMMLIFIAPNLTIAYVGSFIVGIAIVAGSLPVSSAFQMMVPNRLRGRISSINNMISGFAIPISYGAIGFLGDIIGAQYCFLISAVLFLSCMCLSLLITRLRKFQTSDAEKQTITSGAKSTETSV